MRLVTNIHAKYRHVKTSELISRTSIESIGVTLNNYYRKPWKPFTNNLQKIIFLNLPVDSVTDYVNLFTHFL